MKLEKIIEKLEYLQKWRRGSNDIPQPSPRDVGETIDEAIKVLKLKLKDSRKIIKKIRNK